MGVGGYLSAGGGGEKSDLIKIKISSKTSFALTDKFITLGDFDKQFIIGLKI